MIIIARYTGHSTITYCFCKSFSGLTNKTHMTFEQTYFEKSMENKQMCSIILKIFTFFCTDCNKFYALFISHNVHNKKNASQYMLYRYKQRFTPKTLEDIVFVLYEDLSNHRYWNCFCCCYFCSCSYLPCFSLLLFITYVWYCALRLLRILQVVIYNARVYRNKFHPLMCSTSFASAGRATEAT